MLNRRACLGLLAAPTLVRAALAQPAFPNRPVRIVIGFPPGGGIDIVARLMAPKLAERFGQPFVVENRPGANGLIATQAVAQSEPDGHSMLFGTTGNFAVNPVLYANPGFDIERDLAPLTQVASLPFLLMINPSVPAQSFPELIALAKARPGALNFCSSGNGGLPHLSGELMNMLAGTRISHVPYRGSAPALNDLIAGQVQILFDVLAIGQPHIESGRVRALATTGPTRMELFGGLPPTAETVPGFEVVNAYGMLVRAGTPAAIVQRLQAEIAGVMTLPDIRERFAALGVEAVGSTPEAFGAFIRSETMKWGRVIRSAGVRPE
ncbi:Bug family tripartite tricarboxylate transporter substrate binding protein [Muricoccus radiodurans]|uniref:Bug family tripartite tricarboxylate transporter substrate binding protein n=1 Tax=Muricoccus radiodurans TaxID=2231721 RepID=UPI003CED43A4